MSENQNQSPQQPAPRGGAPIPAFTVEFGDDHCRGHFTISTPPISRMVRGRFDRNRMAMRRDMGSLDGKKRGMRNLSDIGNRIPAIPGMMLEVDQRRGAARLFDPLAETKDGREALEEYNQLVENNPGQLPGPYSAEQEVKFNLDEHQMKTLLFELLRKADSGSLSCVKGELPKFEAVDRLPGDEFYDPANKSAEKPRFKKDLEAWKDRMRQAGVI